MNVFRGARIRQGFVVVWTLLTAGFLLTIATLILLDPKFPLDLGLIRTTGRAGLWATLLPGVIGLLTIVLLFLRRALSAWMLTLYCTFWLAILASGLHAVWNAKRSFCIESINFCITTPWLGRAIVIALGIPFLLSAIWSWRQAICLKDSQAAR